MARALLLKKQQEPCHACWDAGQVGAVLLFSILVLQLYDASTSAAAGQGGSTSSMLSTSVVVATNA
jgi:hypothetical protein